MKIIGTLLSITCLTMFTACAEYQGGLPSTTDATPSTTDGGSTDNPYLVARACGPDCIEFNGLYCDNSTAQLVGDGASEGITSWTSGKTLTKGSNGWFRYILVGDVQELHFTLYGCGNSPTSCQAGSTWADYGCP